MTHYEGTCDVCGGALSIDHDSAKEGIIDIWLDDSGFGTWIRHINGPKADCERYSSRVRGVAEKQAE